MNRNKEAVEWVENYFETNDCGWRTMPTMATTGKRRGDHNVSTIRVLDRDDDRLFPKPHGQPWLQLYENYEKENKETGHITYAAFKKLRGDRFPENIYRIERRLCKEKGSNMQSTWRNTPLNLSCANGDVNIVRSILADGSNKLDIDRQDYHDKTALHHAITAANNAVEIVVLLLQEGARYDIRDNENELPLDIANRIGRVDVANAINTEHERRHTNPGYKRPRLEDYLPASSNEASADNDEEDDEDSESSDDEDEL